MRGRLKPLAGAVAILIGVSLLLEIAFGIQIPIAQLVVALLLVLVGARWAVQWRPGGRHVAVLRQATFAAPGNGSEELRYEVLLAKSTIDLRRLPPIERDVIVGIDVVLGEAVVELSENTLYVVEGHAVLGSAELPDHIQVLWGPLNYRPPERGVSGARVRLRLDVVLGRCVVREAGRSA